MQARGPLLILNCVATTYYVILSLMRINLRSQSVKPVLYSFRRCPYAIRARMAINYSAVQVELREVLLSDKPQSMLDASPKGTVPVLVFPEGKVVDESVDVMHWALGINDPDDWRREELAAETEALIEENDFSFKVHLDHYKYSDRFPEFSKLHYRTEAEAFLLKLEQRLEKHQYLLDDKLRFADIAIFPFVRQFAFVDKPWFDQSPYPALQCWLKSILASRLFETVMVKNTLWKDITAH